MAAFGGLGFATTAQAAEPSKPAPGEKLAKEQVFRYGGGGWYPSDPASHDFNKDLYCQGVTVVVRRPHGLQRRFSRRAVHGDQGRGQQGRLGLDLHDPQGLAVVRQRSRLGARLRVLVEAAAEPREQGALRLVPLRHQERRGLQQEADHRREPGRRPGQGRLDARGDARRAARLLPGPRGLPRRAAGLSARRREVRRQVDRGRQHRLQRPVRARVLGAQQADDAPEEPVLLRRQGRPPDEGRHPDHPGRLRRAALREQRDRHDARSRPATSSACSRIRALRRTCSAIPSRAPGTSCRR